MTSINKHRIDLINSLAALTTEAAKITMLPNAVVCVILDRDAKTLQRARQLRDESIVARLPIHPLHLASMKHIPPSEGEKGFAYPASEVRNLIARKVAAAQDAVLAEPDLPQARGFASFMAHAMPMDTWPFAIQPDGRPMDLFLALEAGLPTDDLARLTLREFGERLADASSEAFHRWEADEVRSVTIESEPAEECLDPADSAEDGAHISSRSIRI